MAVYFIRAGETDAIKIGSSANPRIRLRLFQAGNAETLRIIKLIEAGPKAERQIQKHYRERHIRSEWFRFCPTMLRIEEIIDLDFSEGRNGSPPGWMRTPIDYDPARVAA